MQVCPTGALTVHYHTYGLYRQKELGKKLIIQVAPSVRITLAEALGEQPGVVSTGRLVSALKRLGFYKVFDSDFSADLTIMEEGTELLNRLQNGGTLPMITSCCPAWVKYCETYAPEYTKHLSTAKSPQQMFGAVAKSWLAHRLGIEPENVYSISIMPCIAKKAERELPGMQSAGAGSDVDLVLTTRELARIVRAEHIDVEQLADSPFDDPLGNGSGAGVIFGATGGVMEAALRSAYFLATGENPSADAFCEVRAAENESRPWREAAFDLAGTTIHCAVASGLANARHLIRAIKRREVHYEFVEIMACPGGCAGGGGQPVDGSDREKAASRGDVLFSLDEKAELRFSHENPAVKALYNEYLSGPCSERAEELLHCDHFAWQMPQTGIHV